RPRELVIYTDESDRDGRYFSNFYGGALVRSTDLALVIDQLERAKIKLHFHGEVKWQKVTENYLDKYKLLIDEFLDLVDADKVKIRVMFTQNRVVPKGLTHEQRQNEFHLLYYQFIKHAFGLQYANDGLQRLPIRLNLDQLPANREQIVAFKSFVLRLNQNPQFRAANVQFREDQIAEVASHDHVVMQCLDVVLGAMCFRLNNKHTEKPPGQRRRGKRTIAKEKLYKHVVGRIRKIHPNFNIGDSTGILGDVTNRWRQPYRHWKFTPTEHDLDDSKNKPK
ncbi:MAG TPA: DUF3800 domain-containing protein, partial [Tepidisphaeraceae bacterium]|nr:DUF3800 domain-containing protein [Tepidisphaeraceae bacterium]